MFLTLSIKAIVKQWTVSLWQGTVEFGRPYNRMLTIVPGQKWKDLRTTLSPAFSAFKMKHAGMYVFAQYSVCIQQDFSLHDVNKNRRLNSIQSLQFESSKRALGDRAGVRLYPLTKSFFANTEKVCNCRSSIFSNAFSLENCRDGKCRNSIVFPSRIFSRISFLYALSTAPLKLPA